MYKYFIYFIVIVIVAGSCKKATNLNGGIVKDESYVSFTNVNASGKQINVIVDGNKLNLAGVIAPNATVSGIYLGVAPGARATIIRDSSSASNIDYYTDNINVEAGSSYSYFVYDTLTSGKFKGILLNTDRNPDVNYANSKIRFLNLSPKSPALDFWLVRRVGGTVTDSLKIFSGVPYLGNTTPDPVALSAFTPVAASQAAGANAPGSAVTDYIIRIRNSSTNAVVSSTAATTLANARNYTFFAKGIYPSTSLISFFNN